MNEQKPYMPHVAFAMDDFKARARKARQDAAKLITQAEVWEEAAMHIDIALGKEKKSGAVSENAQ